MKHAKAKSGALISAAEGAPPEATCPHCSQQVLLRSRRTMGHQVTYYWRHANNRGRNCRGRSNPIMWKNSSW